MILAAGDAPLDRRRWATCFAAIAALHAAAVWLAVHWSVASPPTPPPVVMTIELPPLPAPRQRVHTVVRRPPRAIVGSRAPEPVRRPIVAPVHAAPVVRAPNVTHPRPAPVRVPAVAQPALEAPPIAAAAQPVTQSQIAATPAPAVATAAPTLAPPAAPSNAVSTWQGQVLARLEKFKRYPSAAQFRHQQGVVYVRFAMDRRGHVVSARIDKSSGVDALDAEALALMHRAEPLPPPPPDVPGDPVELVVPIQFFLKAAP